MGKHKERKELKRKRSSKEDKSEKISKKEHREKHHKKRRENSSSESEIDKRLDKKRHEKKRNDKEKHKEEDNRKRGKDREYRMGHKGAEYKRNNIKEVKGDKEDREYRTKYGKDSRTNSMKDIESDWKQNAEKEQKEKSGTTQLLTTKTGGAYIPPAKLRMMQQNITDKSSIEYQRLAWEALKKSIHGLINKVNTSNIGIIVRNLFKENVVRGRGLLCRSLLQAQVASPKFTNVYAALIAVINSKFPSIGNLFLRRVLTQFKRSYRRNDKLVCVPSVTFIAHLVNQKVCHEVVALQILMLLLENVSESSIEVAITLLKECGSRLTEVSPKGLNAIFEMLRNVLHEGTLDKRVQYMIEVVFQVRKDKFKDYPSVIPELDLIDEEDQFTHMVTLDERVDGEDILNVFKFDEEYALNEERYVALRKDILGDDEESGEGSENEDGSEDEEEESGEDSDGDKTSEQSIIDKTETNLVAFRRTVYLTICSSLDFEECAHKLLKMQIKPGEEKELCNMFIDCCAEQRTYEKFYGLLAERFCKINRSYKEPLEELFAESYNIVHRFDTNKLRNVAKFFAHQLFTDAISWEVLSIIRLTETDTTSSSRIFVKILFQELCEYMGMKKLYDRLREPELQPAVEGIFPKDDLKNTRFSINFFTSIGLGGLSDDLRAYLKSVK